MFSKIIYILLTLLIFLIFPQKVNATPIIKIDSFPSTAISGQEFDINFSVSELSVDTNYYAKSLGGIDFNEVDTWNSNWLQQNAAWTNMPTFLSNAEGSASGVLKSRFALTTSEGNKDYKIRIRKTDGTTNYDSDVVTILISTPSPSPTPTPTNPPTQAPTQAPTASPTKSPTSVPTKTVTSKPTSKPTPTEKSTEESLVLEPQVLSLSTIASSPEPEKNLPAGKQGKLPIVAIILIISGIGCLGYGGYLLYNMKHASKEIG